MKNLYVAVEKLSAVSLNEISGHQPGRARVLRIAHDQIDQLDALLDHEPDPLADGGQAMTSLQQNIVSGLVFSRRSSLTV